MKSAKKFRIAPRWRHNLLVFIALLLTATNASAAFADDDVRTSDWSRFTRGFRQDHNFSMTAGVVTTKWNLNKFGSVTAQEYTTTGYYSKFQYSFHLPIYQSLGFFLGSSVGYLEYQFNADDAFQPAPTFMFPGILSGLALNLTPVFRLGTALDYYLERWSGMRELDSIDDDTRVHITVETIDLSIFVDMFYTISWATKLEIHQRRSFYPKPLNPGGFPVDLAFSKNDVWIGLGAAYHLL